MAWDHTRRQLACLATIACEPGSVNGTSAVRATREFAELLLAEDQPQDRRLNGAVLGLQNQERRTRVPWIAELSGGEKPEGVIAEQLAALGCDWGDISCLLRLRPRPAEAAVLARPREDSEELGFELLVALASLAGQALKLWEGTNRCQQGIGQETWIAEESALDSMLQHVQGR